MRPSPGLGVFALPFVWFRVYDLWSVTWTWQARASAQALLRYQQYGIRVSYQKARLQHKFARTNSAFWKVYDQLVAPSRSRNLRKKVLLKSVLKAGQGCLGAASSSRGLIHMHLAVGHQSPCGTAGTRGLFVGRGMRHHATCRGYKVSR